MDFTTIEKLVPPGWSYRVGYNASAARNLSGLFKSEEMHFYLFAVNEKEHLLRGISADSFDDLIEKLKQLIAETK